MPFALSELDPPSTGKLAPVIQRAPSNAKEAITSAKSSCLPLRSSLNFKRELTSGLSLAARIQSVDLSPPWELLCYLMDPVGIERNMS